MTHALLNIRNCNLEDISKGDSVFFYAAI